MLDYGIGPPGSPESSCEPGSPLDTALAATSAQASLFIAAPSPPATAPPAAPATAPTAAPGVSPPKAPAMAPPAAPLIAPLLAPSAMSDRHCPRDDPSSPLSTLHSFAPPSPQLSSQPQEEHSLPQLAHPAQPHPQPHPHPQPQPQPQPQPHPCTSRSISWLPLSINQRDAMTSAYAATVFSEVPGSIAVPFFPEIAKRVPQFNVHCGPHLSGYRKFMTDLHDDGPHPWR